MKDFDIPYYKHPNYRISPTDPNQLMVGMTGVMIELFGYMCSLAKVKQPVLIQGPSGVGKELVAQGIANHSGYKGCTVVNMPTLEKGTAESILFGSQAGAFTGVRTRPGLLAKAHGGTLFLDEVGELEYPVQSELLRFLQNGTFVRVGGTKEEKVYVRVISATNKDLQSEVKQGRFREDLYYRLAVHTIQVPSLCERADDIPYLTRHFIKRYADGNCIEVPILSDEAQEELNTYQYPGNVRELETIITKSCFKWDMRTQGEGKIIRADISLDGHPLNAGGRQRQKTAIQMCIILWMVAVDTILKYTVLSQITLRELRSQ